MKTMSNNLMTIEEILDAVRDCAEEIEWLARHRVLMEISFGRRDSEGGYGWFNDAHISFTMVGKRCQRCAYDETLPRDEFAKVEHDLDMNRPGHRHSYAHAEKWMMGWDSFGEQKPLKEAIRDLIEIIQVKY